MSSRIFPNFGSPKIHQRIYRIFQKEEIKKERKKKGSLSNLRDYSRTNHRSINSSLVVRLIIQAVVRDLSSLISLHFATISIYFHRGCAGSISENGLFERIPLPFRCPVMHVNLPSRARASLLSPCAKGWNLRGEIAVARHGGEEKRGSSIWMDLRPYRSRVCFRLARARRNILRSPRIISRSNYDPDK